MVVYICNLYMKKNYFLLPITHSKIGCVLVLATNIGRHNDERGICVFNLYVHPVHRRTGRGLVEVGCIPGAMHRRPKDRAPGVVCGPHGPSYFLTFAFSEAGSVPAKTKKIGGRGLEAVRGGYPRNLKRSVWPLLVT